MKVSAKIREEAARLCSIAACYGEPITVTYAVASLYGITHDAARRKLVARVAVRAWDAAHRAFIRGGRDATDAAAIRDDYAEAEALLRTGWKP